METEPPSPAALLDARLSDLEAFWLELRCCKITHYPLRLMSERRGGNLLLRDVLDRLRCDRCRSRPARVAVVESALTDGKGRRRGWSVPILENGS